MINAIVNIRAITVKNRLKKLAVYFVLPRFYKKKYDKIILVNIIYNILYIVIRDKHGIRELLLSIDPYNT
jgi:hypothetical protein